MDEEVLVARRRFPRGRIIALALLLLLLSLLVALWLQRKAIATNFIDRELERRGVQARYEITRLDPWTQRLENVVIGDPANPDLTARWARVHISYGLRSPRVWKIEARGVRVAGRLVGGKLRLGQLDRLLPPPSGAPFRLPDLVVDVDDVVMRLDTPHGRVGLAFEGKGNMSGGFDGRLAAASHMLRFGGCSVRASNAILGLSVRARKPRLQGPLRAISVDCGPGLFLDRPLVAMDTLLAPALDSWIGRAQVAATSGRSGEHVLSAPRARLTFSGDSRLTKGGLDLDAAAGRLAGFTGSRLGIDGSYSYAMQTGRFALDGDLSARGVSASAAQIASLRSYAVSLAGTPVEPLGRALAEAAARAAAAFDLSGRLGVEHGTSGGGLRIGALDLVSRSGARASIGGQGLLYNWPTGTTRLATSLNLEGGGFPAISAQLSQPRTGGSIRGTARVAPFAAGGARLALGTISFMPGPRGTTMVRTSATLDGPLGDGRITGLSLPIVGRLGGGGFVFGEGCTDAGFRSLQISGLILGPTRLPLCPTGRAIVWKEAGGSVRGGGVVRNLRLAGRLGSSPITIAPQRLSFDIGTAGFTAANVAVRLGGAGYVNRLDLGTLAGRFVQGGVTGTFAGTSGKIANVPLLLSDAAGKWQLIDGKAAIDGSLAVADEADPSRFHPLRSDDFHLTIVDNRVDATGWLHDPDTGTRVARATIVHGLDSGRGRALLDVPGITFGPDYQPEQLTRLTTGVIALIVGSIQGSGEIEWDPQGTRSTGTFSTADMDLAAPFGPVSGIKGTIRFSDLLGLTTEPGQTAEVEEVLAGITVYNGKVRYQLLPDLRIRVESAVWPYAGGELALEETILDFSKPTEKRLTFRVTGMDAALFVQQMEFSNIAATGTFDGVIPMIFDERGGRIAAGHLEARPPGGDVSYVGELTDKELGAYGKLAFDALKSLRYSKLSIRLDGSLEGEFIAGVELDGIARNAPGPGGIAGAALAQLAKIPFEFNITARGPFRALIGTMRSLEDPTLLIQTAIAQERLRQIAPEALAPNAILSEPDVQVEESEVVQ